MISQSTKIKLLIVDDESFNIEYLSAILEQYPEITVDCAFNGQ